MSHEHVVIWVLSAVVVLLLAMICGGIAGFLHHLDGNRLPAALMKAGTAFGACLTLSAAVVGLMVRMT